MLSSDNVFVTRKKKVLFCFYEKGMLNIVKGEGGWLLKLKYILRYELIRS